MLKTDRKIRKTRIRSKLSGSAIRPRVSVFRSNRSIVAQAIDDKKQVTIATVNEHDVKSEKVTKVEKAKLVGMALADKLTKLKIKQIVFDRSGYRYHGRIKAVADGLREKGVQV